MAAVTMWYGLAAGLLVFTMLDLVFSEQRRVGARLSRLSTYESSQATDAEPMLAPFRSRVAIPALAAVARIFRAAAPHSYLRSLDRRLVYAGSPHGWDAGRLFTVQVLLGGMFSVIVGLGRVAAGQKPTVAIALGFAAGLIAFLIPNAWLSMRVSRRQERIRRDLPDLLDMLLISVEAGLGFDSAVAKIVRRTPGPLSEEFGRMLRDGQAGLSRREALKRLSERNDVPELNAFIMAMIQADVFGVSIANILRAQAREMRVKRRQHAQELAQKAPAKMVFPLILCILPATLIVLMGPAVLAILRAFGGVG